MLIIAADRHMLAKILGCWGGGGGGGGGGVDQGSETKRGCKVGAHGIAMVQLCLHIDKGWEQRTNLHQ